MPKAIILGASPNGLYTARSMLLRGIWPIILEPSGSIAGRPCRHQPVDYHCISILGELYLHQLVQTIYFVRDEICSIHTINNVTGELTLFMGDFFYSPLPLIGLGNQQFRNLITPI
jgi:hypothetical protein